MAVLLAWCSEDCRHGYGVCFFFDNECTVRAGAYAPGYLHVTAAVALDHLAGLLISTYGGERTDKHARAAPDAPLLIDKHQPAVRVATQGSCET